MGIAAPLADIAIIVVAIFALVLIMASRLLVRMLGAFLSHIPDIWPINKLKDLANWAEEELASLAGWLWSHCNPVTVFTSTWNWLVQTIFKPIVDGIAAAGGAIYRTITHTIPQAIAAALGTIWQWVKAAEATAAALVTGAISQAWAFAHYVEVTLSGELVAAEQFIEADIRAVEAAGQAALTAVEAEIAAMVARSLQDVLAELDKVAAVIRAEVAVAISDVLGRIKTTEDFITQNLVPSLSAVGAVATAVALDWGVWKVKCGNTLCGGLSNLANDFVAAEGLITEAMLLAMLAELIANPAAAAAEIQSLLIGPVNEIVSALGLGKSAAA